MEVIGREEDATIEESTEQCAEKVRAVRTMCEPKTADYTISKDKWQRTGSMDQKRIRQKQVTSSKEGCHRNRCRKRSQDKRERVEMESWKMKCASGEELRVDQ